MVQQWLTSLQPIELLFNAILQIIHPELWNVTTLASQQLANQLAFHIPCWPTAFTGLDLIVNQVTEPHLDSGRAITFYDHFLSLGMDHHAELLLDDLEAKLVYSEGTSVFLAGRVLTHSVPAWSGGERVALAHYTRDEVLHRLGCPRLLLPTQVTWWMLRSLYFTPIIFAIPGNRTPNLTKILITTDHYTPYPKYRPWLRFSHSLMAAHLILTSWQTLHHAYCTASHLGASCISSSLYDPYLASCSSHVFLMTRTRPIGYDPLI